MLICILWMLLIASCWCQAQGAWKMVPAKSRLGSGSPAKAITARYEARSDVEVWTFQQVRTDGTVETTSQTLHFDGKEYPCGDLGLEEQPDTVVSRRIESM